MDVLNATPNANFQRPMQRVMGNRAVGDWHLEVGRLEIWTARLDVGGDVSALGECLSEDERARAARVVSPRDRDRFVTSRAFLRHVLGRATACAPADVRFVYGAHGKPSLDATAEGIQFNLAHSEALAVCVVARGCGDVGVDVEHVRPLNDLDGLVRLTCGPGERARLEALEASQREGAFFEVWTRKEAVLKALGSGLARPLGSLEVAFGPGQPPQVLSSDEPADLSMSLRSFEPAPGYLGAVATRGPVDDVRSSTWTWS
jgi:4'-phosphopantetheinyl transferase